MFLADFMAGVFFTMFFVAFYFNFGCAGQFLVAYISACSILNVCNEFGPLLKN